MQLFSRRAPLVSIGVDIMGLQPKSKSGRRFLQFVTDRFTKLTHAVTLRNIDSFTVARAFAEEWVFKYGAPETMLAYNGSQFDS